MKIDSDANDYLSTMEAEFSQRSFNAYIAGATEYAQWKVKHDELKALHDRQLTTEQQLLKAAGAAHADNQQLKERCDKMEAALKEIYSKSTAAVFPYLPVENMGAQMCVEIGGICETALARKGKEVEG